MPQTELVRPPDSVLAAWSLADPEPLDGGQGTTWRSGDVVLKPTIAERETTWLAAELAALPDRRDVRIIRPVAAHDGRWVVDAWCAWGWLEGTHQPHRWDEVLDVADRFHDAIADIAWSPALERSHAWARGDAFAWGETELDVPPSLASLVRELEARRTTLELPSQLIHGDLCNNVLFADDAGLAPAVIDVSPFWRPPRYAQAIVVADVVGWFGGDERTVAPLTRDDDGIQLLLRAILFRLGSAVVLCDDAGTPERLDGEVRAYERLVGLLPG